MKKLTLILVLLPLFAFAQTYKYIRVDDGLSNRRVSSIQKDLRGYMWFLTNEGVDRYNGKEIKHYKLMDETTGPASQVNAGWMYVGTEEDLWAIGRKGCIFRYDASYDRFRMKCKLGRQAEAVTFAYKDRNERIWLCYADSISFYHTTDGTLSALPNPLGSHVTMIEQEDSVCYFIATEQGVRHVRLSADGPEGGPVLTVLPEEALDELAAQVNEVCYHPASGKLFIGTFAGGVCVYDLHTRQVVRPAVDLSDVSITRIAPVNDDELLIATEGMGLYKIRATDCVIEPFLTANYESDNEMNSNNISDIYIDKERRVWLAAYPEGVTVVDNRYNNYRWMKHSIGNSQSLVNNQVNAVIEDGDGDLWFGTSNGISLYRSSTGQWHSFLSSSDRNLKDKNHIFTTLCEVSPGVIWAGGYTSGIYVIDKRTLTVNYFSPFQLASLSNVRPDKYIRDIMKDSKGCVWSGGFYNLKCFDLNDQTARYYPGISSVTAIIEKDDRHIWVGTTTGLYLLDRESGHYERIVTPGESNYINALYQSDEGLLYIGTGGSGVHVYHPDTRQFESYHTHNCALISNNIYTILPEMDGSIVMSTEDGITSFDVHEQTFRNWTREQGLQAACFNSISGTLRRNGGFVLGSTEGAVEFPGKLEFPHYAYSPMILSDLHVSYRPVYPGEENSPLEDDINRTEVLRLSYDQNTFSLLISSINYDFPSNVMYSWKLDGFYDDWIRTGDLNRVRFTNLNPGTYLLRIRALSREEQDRVFEERVLKIIISHPWWLDFRAIVVYICVLMLIMLVIFRLVMLRKEKEVSEEKTRFFINTAHDIRTPLTLIKAPLEELAEHETFTSQGQDRIRMAMRHVDNLMRLSNNLINFERTDVYSSELFLAEYNLNAYLQDVHEVFRSYASFKRIDFTWQSEADDRLKVWFDKEKMDSILKNILSNAMKYTPECGKVSIRAYEDPDSWTVEVADTGIGVSAQEQGKLFRRHFRAANAINSKVAGSGIGLMLTRKLVRLHKGRITFNSTLQRGTTVTIVFPKGKDHFRKYTLVLPDQGPMKQPIALGVPVINGEKVKQPVDKSSLPRVLIVEDNDDLRAYLADSLSDAYYVQTCCNGKEALTVTKTFWPELIVSDIMMPVMNGNELCAAIKSDIETSHIPVLLLTALSQEQHVVDGLLTGADDYIAKPFNINILRASISSLLSNRALLRAKYMAMVGEPSTAAVPTAEPQPMPDMHPLDLQFISDIRTNVINHLDDPDFTVDSLCALHHMSRSSFYNKLKVLTGQSPADYVRLIRLNRAAELLKENRYSVTEVSEMTGFSDSKYFREVFKKHFKVSPSKYAKGELSVEEE